MPPKISKKVDAILLILEKYGFPTFWACVVCVFFGTCAWFVRTDILLPAMQEFRETHKSLRDNAGETTRCLNETKDCLRQMKDQQAVQTQVLHDVKEFLVEDRR